MSNTDFSRNIIFLLLANVLIKPLYIIEIEAEVQNLVGPSDYGLFFSLFNFCFLFTIILDPGINNYNSKYIAENRDHYLSHISTTIWIKFFLGLVFLAIVYIGGLLMGYPAAYFDWLPWIGLYFFLSSFYVYLKSHFPALGLYSREIFFSIFDKLLLIVLLGYQLYVLKDISIERFLQSLILCYVITNLTVVFLLKDKITFSIFPRSKQFFSLLKASFAFALVSLFSSILNRLDGVMLERILLDEGYAAGIYAAAYRILDAANMFAFLFASLLVPMFAHALSKKEKIGPLLKESAMIMFSITIILTTILYFEAEGFLGFVYDDINETYIQTFRTLFPGFICMGMSFIFGSLIVANGKLKALNTLYVFLILLNLTLNFYFIPILESQGAAIATLITQFLLILGEYIILVGLFRSGLNIQLCFKMLCYLVLSLFIGTAIQRLGLSWIVDGLIIGIILLITSFLLGFIRLDTIFRQKEM